MLSGVENIGGGTLSSGWSKKLFKGTKLDVSFVLSFLIKATWKEMESMGVSSRVIS